MPKDIKTIWMILGIVVLNVAAICLFLWLFVRNIYRARTCEWANIDNVELHAEVNIPAIHDCDCVYKKEQNVKLTRFDIDKGKVGLDNYILENHFRKLRSIADIHFEQLLMEQPTIDSLKTSSDLYYTKGSYKGEKWQTLLDYATGRLWVTIEYND